MKKKKLSDEHRLIFLTSKLEINNPDQEEITGILSRSLDWDEIISSSVKQHVLPLLYYSLNRLNLLSLVPQDISLKMKYCYYANLTKNLLIEKEIQLISKLAKNEGVRIIPLKGFSLMEDLYRNPGLRIMADVDMFIDKNDLQKTKNIFKGLFYEENTAAIEKKDDRHMAVFSKKLSSDVLLHIEIHGILAYDRPYRIIIPRLWERVEEKTTNGQAMLYLSKEDTFLSLILHLRSHTRRLTLKFIVDIAEFLNINGDALDWNYIIEISRNNRIVSSVYLFICIAKELLGARVSDKIIDQISPNIVKTKLIYMTINKHNFFTMKKWQGAFLRLLCFDRPVDFILYLWRVCLLERFIMPLSARFSR